MHEIELSRKKEAEKKPKQVKGASQQESLDLYSSGKTIEEITEIRSLKATTIASHLSQFLKTGEVKIEDFLATSKREEAVKLMEKNPEESAYKNLYNFLDPTELTFFATWLRLQEK